MFTNRYLIAFFFVLSLISIAAKPDKLNSNQQKQIRTWVHALTLSPFIKQTKKKRLFQIKVNQINRWSKKNQDCSGFVRYLLWEASQRHNLKWQQHHGSFLTKRLQDYRGPKISLYYKNHKKNFVSAESLLKYNSKFLGRDKNSIRLKELDLIFFKHSFNNQPYHTMLLIRNYDNGDWFVVYHTGKPQNKLKLVPLKIFNQEFTNKFRIHTDNKYFLGYFRLKILS